jgi:hypothetical protein
MLLLIVGSGTVMSSIILGIHWTKNIRSLYCYVLPPAPRLAHHAWVKEVPCPTIPFPRCLLPLSLQPMRRAWPEENTTGGLLNDCISCKGFWSSMKGKNVDEETDSFSCSGSGQEQWFQTSSLPKRNMRKYLKHISWDVLHDMRCLFHSFRTRTSSDPSRYGSTLRCFKIKIFPVRGKY